MDTPTLNLHDLQKKLIAIREKAWCQFPGLVKYEWLKFSGLILAAKLTY